ncbi:flagellar hook-associated protein 1 FlgK [Anaerotaenia torta]|uniref:flagellar hook-associated protein FlgK n=1 Tax=Anaerotaenia torta TaxID=433293 RepID=UPI003D22281A
MSGLYIGVSGLNVSQAALNVTSHNLANVDTTGYVRQQAVLADFNYIKLGESYISPMMKGLGANFAMVKQVRDVFLDQSYRQEIGRQAFYEAQYKAVEEVEGLFGELEGEAFQNTMNDLWVALQELAKEPDSVVARASVIQTAVTFIERAENISKQLNDYQVNLNTQINDQVKRINEIGEEIQKLNWKIRQYESNGMEKANDLRDKRNNLLDELGKLVRITYKEGPDAMVSVNVEGVPFVTEDMVFEMGTAKLSEGSPMLKPVWVAFGNEDVFNLDRAAAAKDNTDIGSLKGLLTARGYKQANHTDIPKRENYESDVKYDAAVIDFNNSINASVIMSTQAQFDQLIHGIVTTINSVLCPTKEVTLSDGTTARILDVENAPVGMDENKTMGEPLFIRKSTPQYGEEEYVTYLKEDGTYDSVYTRIYRDEDPADNYSLFTLGEIEVNPAIMQSYALLPLASNKGTGDFDIEAAQNLISKWQSAFSTLSPNSLTEYNFSDYYTAFVAELANRGEQLYTISENQTAMADSINDQRSRVTGVSSDEELTNLIKFQHAYNASARYVNVVSEMLEHIIMRMF